MLRRQLLLAGVMELLLLLLLALVGIAAEEQIREAVLASVVSTCVGQGQRHQWTLHTLRVVLLQNVPRLVLVLCPKRYMDATVAVVLLGVGMDDGAQCGGLEGRG